MSVQRRPGRGQVVWRKIVVGPELDALAAECKAVGRGFGLRITEIKARYDALMERYNPRERFDDEQWAALVEILGEKLPDADLLPTAHVAEVVKQAGRPGLAHKILALSLVELVALVEAIDRDIVKRLLQEGAGNK
jgi:hypothetical protein